MKGNLYYSSDARFVVGLGEVLWDVFPRGKRLGGAPANFAYHAGQFGHEALVVSAVGMDRNGKALVAELEKHGLRLPSGPCRLPDGDGRCGPFRPECAGLYH